MSVGLDGSRLHDSRPGGGLGVENGKLAAAYSCGPGAVFLGSVPGRSKNGLYALLGLRRSFELEQWS